MACIVVGLHHLWCQVPSRVKSLFLYLNIIQGAIGCMGHLEKGLYQCRGISNVSIVTLTRFPVSSFNL